jgi:ADP-ribose pyrophosphatase YjhB (NUDIX family)
MWGLPGGHVEDGETPDVASSRETLEETRLKAKAAKLIDVHYRLTFDNLGRPTTVVIFYFLMEEEDATAVPVPGDDVEELRLVDAPEFAQLVGNPFIQARIPGTVWNKLSSINSI